MSTHHRIARIAQGRGHVLLVQNFCPERTALLAKIASDVQAAVPGTGIEMTQAAHGGSVLVELRAPFLDVEQGGLEHRRRQALAERTAFETLQAAAAEQEKRLSVATETPDRLLGAVAAALRKVFGTIEEGGDINASDELVIELSARNVIVTTREAFDRATDIERRARALLLHWDSDVGVSAAGREAAAALRLAVAQEAG